MEKKIENVSNNNNTKEVKVIEPFVKYKDGVGNWGHAHLNTTGYNNGSGTSNTLEVTSSEWIPSLPTPRLSEKSTLPKTNPFMLFFARLEIFSRFS